MTSTLPEPLLPAAVYARAFHRSSDAISVTRLPDGLIVDMNESFLRLTGFRREELVGKTTVEALALDLDSREAIVERIAREGSARGLEAWIGTKSGERRLIRISADVMELEGEPHVFAISSDVTDLRRAADQLREAEERYRTLVEQLPAATYIDDIEPEGSRVRYVSPQIESMLGYPVDDWMRGAQFWSSILHPDDRERVLAEDRGAREGGEPFELEYRLIAADGRVVWIHDRTAFVRDPEGNLILAQGVMLDVTERKREEERREGAETRYRRLFEDAEEGIFETTPDGRILVANPAFARITGYGSPEAVMSSVRDVRHLYADGARRDELMRMLAERGSVRNFEAEGRRPDGGAFWASVNARGILDDEGRLQGIQGTITDITERILAERERRRLLARLVEAQEGERGRIASDIHDDPVQKMTAVALRIHALRRRSTEPEQLEALEQLEGDVGRAIERLRRLLFELRPPALDREGLASALRIYLREAAPEGGFEFELRSELIDEPPVETRTIAYRITQEALVNIRKHARATRVVISLQPEGDGLRVRISDDGVGVIPASEHEPGSPGHIGVDAMRERAELAGGWWRMESTPGSGTTVVFWVPNQPSPPGATPGHFGP